MWQNRMLAPPPGSWRPLLGEILDPPLVCIPVVTQAIAKLNYSVLRVDTPFCALFQIKMSFEIAKAGWLHRLSKWIFTFPEFEDLLRKDVESFFFLR